MSDDVERSEAEKERAAVVAWLRELPWYVALSPKHMRAWKPKELADAIERGDHLQETANP